MKIKYILPDYYKDFSCIKGGCRHNCCIGWEIDVDAKTLSKYKNVDGEFGERLSGNISLDGEAHFILAENERCPFLNSDNLCDIIINLGEDYLCEICDAHPRFINEFPDRTEIGLGLCCEEAARLIISKKEPARFLPMPDLDNLYAFHRDMITTFRDEVIDILQNRELSIDSRISMMLDKLHVFSPSISFDIFSRLEMLNESWGELLKKLENVNPDFEKFALHMKGRETEYEQFLVYLIYRHFANAPDFESAGKIATFAVLGYELVYSLGAVIFSEKGDFTLDDQIELCRLFSSEIEYSDENLYTILDELY